MSLAVGHSMPLLQLVALDQKKRALQFVAVVVMELVQEERGLEL